MSEPTTEAGKRLLATVTGLVEFLGVVASVDLPENTQPKTPGQVKEAFAVAIAALEAEAREPLAKRIEALSYPGHRIVILDGRCAACDRRVQESADYRGGRYRHVREEAERVR